LHVAPEGCLQEKLREKLGSGYLAADLFDPCVDLKMDVTSIPFADNHFDAIYCSHVLEHVPDYRKAMREFFRVLKPGGWAVLLVPITAEKTIEGPPITDPRERLRLFGQEDHVRRYGPDYTERLRSAGFSVTEFGADDLGDPNSLTKMGLARTGQIVHYCTKV
jgi:SAM-dependent methyltransferase